GRDTDCVGAGGCGEIWGGVRGGVAEEGGGGDCEAGAVFERACGEFAEGVASGGESVRGKFCARRCAGGAFVRRCGGGEEFGDGGVPGAEVGAGARGPEIVAGGGGRRGGRRCDGLCGGFLFARGGAGAGADDAGGAGGQRGRREDRGEFAGREEFGGSVLSAEDGAGGPGGAEEFAGAGIPRRAGGSDQVRGDCGCEAVRVPGRKSGEDIAARGGGAGAHYPAIDRDQGLGGEQGRAGIRAAGDFELRAHVW